MEYLLRFVLTCYDAESHRAIRVDWLMYLFSDSASVPGFLAHSLHSDLASATAVRPPAHAEQGREDYSHFYESIDR